MTEADIQALEAEGADPAVVEALCQRVGCATATTTDGTGGTGTGPSLDQEIERQRQLEEERRQQELREQEAERERMRLELERQQQANANVEVEFEGLSRAARAQSQGNYMQAAAICNRFLEGVGPAPDSYEYAEATMCLVRAMHAEGFRHLIRRQALELVLMGPAQEFFEEAFDIFVDVTNDADFYPPAVEDFTGLAVGALPDEFQNRWNYFLGRFFWVSRDYTRALEFLGRVDESAEQAAGAHYLSAVMYLEQQQNRNAVEELQYAVAAQDANESDADVAELAYLALARIAYEIGNLDGALYYYQKIPAESFRHAIALHESMWAYFLKQDWNRAIGRGPHLGQPLLRPLLPPRAARRRRCDLHVHVQPGERRVLAARVRRRRPGATRARADLHREHRISGGLLGDDGVVLRPSGHRRGLRTSRGGSALRGPATSTT